MLLTVTLNTAIDKTYTVEGFALNKVHRPLEVRRVAGGKGINVARVARTLGEEVLALGFAGGPNGFFLQESLKQEGLPHRLTPTKDASRECIAIIDPVNQTQTEINEEGPRISPEEWQEFLTVFQDLLSQAHWIALCGSLPPGCPVGTYAQMISICKRKQKRCALDTSGEPLREGILSQPDLIKCNRNELSTLCNGPLPEDIPRLCQFLRENFIKTPNLLVVITLGAQGAVAVSSTEAWYVSSPEIRFVSAVGSGDAFLAAFLWDWQRRGNLASALEWGVAAGSANAEVYGAGFCRRERIYQLKESVRAEKVLTF